MTVVVENTAQSFCVEDLLKPGMPGKFVEVIEGELVVMNPAGWNHNRVAWQIQLLFHQFCLDHPELDFGTDNDGFLLQRDPDVMLSPDASLFRARPRATDKPWMEFGPQIAVEVLSPSNNAAQVAYKRRKYFQAGAEQVWIANLETQTIEFHFPAGRRVIVQGDEVAQGEGLAAGMSIDLKQIFAIGNA
jgi:Uma2 family endonuclease